jgi:cytochrome c oxidase assembly factor CtaG
VAAFVVPALLVAGSPAALARAAGADRLAAADDSRPLLVLRRPGLAVTLYAAAGFGLAVGVVEDWAATRHGVHLLSYLAVVAAGCLVWSPVARPAPPSPRILDS